jgi:TldD protein
MLEEEIISAPTSAIARNGLEAISSLLTGPNISRIFDAALSNGGEFAEIYAEYSVVNGITLEENKIRYAQSGISNGIGVRVIHGDKTGYAYSERLELADLVNVAKTASFVADLPSTDKRVKIDASITHAKKNSLVRIYPEEVEFRKKLDLLWRANDAAFAADPRVRQVEASIWDAVKIVIIANTEGVNVADERIMVRFNASTLVEDKGKRQGGHHGGGGRIGFELFEKITPEAYAQEAVRTAVVMLDARDAPAGPQEVVLGNGWAGVLLHEAVGHGLEADFNRKGTSLYSGRIGQRVASELVTVIDDGTIPNLRGSINIDDEGTPGERKVLIENGILRGYMVDRLNGKLMGMMSTGSGRRESYHHLPEPRMTNTYMDRGQDDSEEIIRSVKRGFYAKSFGGGQVDISNGQFVFQVTEGYMIEDGRITQPVRGANLIGGGPEVLQKVVMVGTDLEFDTGVGTCGKDGQSMPVGVGMPTCKISEITVGGTNVAGGEAK